MGREDANRIALQAATAVLDAAVPLKVNVGGVSGPDGVAIEESAIDVAASRQETPPWPDLKKYRLDGLSEERDGPWPAPVRLECTWSAGSCLLQLAATRWRRAIRHPDGHRVSLAVTEVGTGRELVWITLADHVRNTRGGEIAQVYASPSLSTRSGELAGIREYINATIRSLVDAAELPKLSPGRIDALRVRIPHDERASEKAEVLPSPNAYRVLVHLALIKLPFLVHGKSTGTLKGNYYIDVDALIREAREAKLDSRRTSAGKYLSVAAMPGGYRGYKVSLDRMLRFLDDAPGDSLDRFLEDELELSNNGVRRRNIRALMRLGLIQRNSDVDNDDVYMLTERGRDYLSEPDEARLFELMHETNEGMLATLVIAGHSSGADEKNVMALLPRLSDLPDLRQTQANARRNWLTSLGLTERASGRDTLTEQGRRVLSAHADEVDELDSRLESILLGPASDHAAGSRAIDEDQESPEDDEDDDDNTATEAADASMAADSTPPEAPPNWAEFQLDLSPKQIESELRSLILPEGLIARVSAALCVGKNLLLIGPPGTGKTQLAKVLARAARAEGYIHGLFTATASADWTTYDTIGGYALQKGGSLEFRPGAFLRAVKTFRWLLIDELNRADVDRAFGELMTVLAGDGCDTTYLDKNNRDVSIGNDKQRYTYWVPNTFRVLATMNTWDKTSLFRLSYALQRRFAVIHVDIPNPDAYARLLDRVATEQAVAPALDREELARVKNLFSPEGVIEYQSIGPAVALDVVRYMRRRQAGGEGMAEALGMFVLPQLEGLGRTEAEGAWRRLSGVLTGWAPARAITELRTRYRELFPNLTRLDALEGDSADGAG